MNASEQGFILISNNVEANNNESWWEEEKEEAFSTFEGRILSISMGEMKIKF